MKIAELEIKVIRKNIKNLYLRVYPADGRICLISPRQLDEATLRQFVAAKIDWIRSKQTQLQTIPRKSPPEYVTGEDHYYRGDRYTLHVIYHRAAPKVVVGQTSLDLYVRFGSINEQRERVLIDWYRRQLKSELPSLIAKWEQIIGVRVDDWGVKRMKTRWGSCNIQARRIWLNLELIKYPPRCLEYVVVHELVHLLERQHGDRFQAYMSQFMPDWRSHQAELDSFLRPQSNL